MPQSFSDIRRAYDLAADAYSANFIDELTHKPRDIELLSRFVTAVGAGERVLDLGCGPGHTTAHLASLGLVPTGVDLSPEMVAKATSVFADVGFAVGDFLQLPDNNDSVAGILAFYCIVHLRGDQLIPAFNEFYRVLKPGGVLLLSFHVGTEAVIAKNFLDTDAVLEFYPFQVSDIQSSLSAAGFRELEICERPPYDIEYPTNRCYVFAYKTNAG